VLVAEVAASGWVVPFRRGLTPAEALGWEALLASLPEALPGGPDSAFWRLAPTGTFSVRSAYRALFRGPGLSWTSHLWKAPIPLKIKIFVWQLLRDRLPSGVEVAKRNGPGNGLCPLCAAPEDTRHIMFSCPAARLLWSFLQEALGPEWQALDLGEFLEVQANHSGSRKRLFWLLFATMSWTLWNVRNKMVIERRRASDSIFKFLAFFAAVVPAV
jgi:hypothetical protein